MSVLDCMWLLVSFLSSLCCWYNRSCVSITESRALTSLTQAASDTPQNRFHVVCQIAQQLVNKHYPGEFGSERLVQRAVDLIMRLVARQEGRRTAAGVHAVPASAAGEDVRQPSERGAGSSSTPMEGQGVI